MEYAKALVPVSVVRRVSVVGKSLSWWPLSAAQPRPFKISTHDRCQRIGVVASSLDDLMCKAKETLLLGCSFMTVVLEEDGTVVDSEDFFRSLPNNTQLMVLEKGQEWTHSQMKKKEVVKLTFDLYKLHPKDFIGCLHIKARLYGMYTVSYDIECMGAKHALMSSLCFLAHVTNTVGHLLLCGSSLVLQYFSEDS
ncbi:cell death activator CIDE-A-like [Arapaima gigas]